ncbi:MAG: helix-turn-helix domain-containing protein [Acidobacteriaceae bacterium]
MMKAHATEDTLLSGIALAIGEAARTRILLSLMDGHARTSTELAALAEVSTSTASAHLGRLLESKLIRVVAEGRHRYYSLGGTDVARVLESLGVLAGRRVRGFVPSTPEPLRKARSCYDHLAGELAVALHDHFIGEGWLLPDRKGGAKAYELSDAGARRLEGIGVDVVEARKLRRRFAYACLDWSERRPHLAGALGAALFQHAVASKWVEREFGSRAVRLTRFGQREALAGLGIRL